MGTVRYCTAYKEKKGAGPCACVEKRHGRGVCVIAETGCRPAYHIAGKTEKFCRSKGRGNLYCGHTPNQPRSEWCTKSKPNQTYIQRKCYIRILPFPLNLLNHNNVQKQIPGSKFVFFWIYIAIFCIHS